MMNNKKIFEVIYKTLLLNNSVSLDVADLDYKDLSKDDYAALKAIEENSEEIEKVISQNLSADWDYEHLFPIDKSILIIAVYQLLFEDKGSKKETSIINHALEQAKKYSTEKSTSFIHGVLSNIAKSAKKPA